MTIGHQAGHYCHFRVLYSVNSDTGRMKKDKRKKIYWEGDGTFDLKVPRVGDKTASEESSFRSLTLRGKKVVLLQSTRQLKRWYWRLWRLLPLAGWSLRSGHLTHAWPVVILYSMVRRLCCRVDHYSCWSMSPTLEVFRCLFSAKRRVYERENIELLVNSMEHFYSSAILQSSNCGPCWKGLLCLAYNVPKCRRGNSNNRSTRDAAINPLLVCRVNTPRQELGQGCEALRQVNYCDCHVNVSDRECTHVGKHTYLTHKIKTLTRGYTERERERERDWLIDWLNFISQRWKY